MSSEVSLLLELYNPLYLFPIVAVVFTALMVYAFGFKSSAQPPTEVVDALNDKHHKNKTSHELVKRRKQPQKSTSSKSEPKTQPNGHINSESSRPSEKKTPKKVVAEQTAVPTTKSSGKRQKNKKTEENDVEVEDKDSGEWVELISKKERKNRKQKEEQLLIEAKDSKTNKEDKISDKAKKTSKKIKPQKNEETIKETINSSPTKTNKETAEVVVNQNTDTNSTNKQNDVNVAEELVPDRDVPDIYGLAKEQRAPKKVQKQRNTKRNSESEANSRAEPPIENEPKPNLNLSDKLTAAIVANYEGNDNKADNVSNKKKKDNKKKKSPQSPTQTNPEINGKQVSISERNEENNTSNELIVEKESNQDIPNVTEMKSSEEDEFKVVTTKKRTRARRE